ncbi:unnamed protein product [Urochloa decumbens]|uniref:Uncharacterized protein n=1 Tax=Urochloa decumbens TaxID=240449 RepID=A0ABC8WU43_9POAL
MTMANAATDPLLASSQEAAAAKEPSIDDVIETYIGDTGALQQQVFISALTDAEPRWHCLAAGSTTGNNSSCSPAPSASPCALPPGSWAWDRPAMTSVVSEWTLTCAGPALVSVPASSFFAGCLAGGFLLAALADSLLGRKRMLVAALASMSLAGALTALAPNVYGREEAPRRGERGVLFVFRRRVPVPPGSRLRAPRRVVAVRVPVDVAAMPLLLRPAPLRRPGVAAVAAGARPEARRRRSAAPDHVAQRDAGGGGWLLASPCWTPCTPRRAASGVGGVFAALRAVSERRWARRRLAAIMAASFGVGMVYFGMPLNVGSLGSDLYLSVAYNALAELPSAALAWVLIGSGGVQPRVRGDPLGPAGACTAFDVMLVYATELFPTSARSSAVGMVRQALVLGGAAAPVLIALGRERVSLFCSFGVFGVAIGCSGLFVACLPETRGKSMSDTMEEEEERNRAVVVASCTGATTAGTTDSGSCIV